MFREKIEVRCDKSQGWQEKLKIGVRKIEIAKRKIEVRYDKNQGCQEKLNKGRTKIKIVKKI